MKVTDYGFTARLYRGDSTPPDALEDISRYSNDGSFKGAGEPDWIQMPSGLWVMSFDGSDDVITVGDCGIDTKTFLAWIYPDDNTTRSIIDLDSGTHSIEIDGSGDLTATGWAGPAIYVNASTTSAAIPESAWSFIAVTTTTAIDSSSVQIGQEANFYDGYLWNPRLILVSLSADQVYSIFQSERGLFGV